MINCCQSLNGLEQIDADVIILDGNNVETELNDLQTQIDNLQTEITNGGGYFQVICERNGSHQNNVYFSFGAGSTSGNLKTYLPNCVVYGIAISSGGIITSAVDVEVIINSTTYTYSVPAATNSVYTNYNLNISVSQGQILQAKFGTAGSGGTDFRISLFCRTSAVNGQSVNFYEPNFTLLNANQNAYLTDSITTSNNTQNHQLHFGIPRGRSVYAYLGSVSSGTAAVSMDSTTNTNGNQEITFNFVLQTGAQGPAGPKGDRGDNGSADPITLAVATAAGAAAGGVAGGAAGAAAGSSSGASAGSAAANAVLATINEEIAALEEQTSVINSKIQFFQPHTFASGLTECGGTTCSLYPTGDLNLGGAVFGTGNTTNNITLDCLNGVNINSAALTIDAPTTLNEDVIMDGINITIEGLTTINNNLDVNGDIELERFLTFNNGTAYDIATIDSVPTVAPTANNQGIMNLNSGNFNVYSLFNIYNTLQQENYPYLVFNTDAGFSNFRYGSILCNTTVLPPSNNGGDFIFACNQLTTSNDLVVNGDLQVNGNFNTNNLTINNLTINNILKTSIIQPLDDNVVMDIGSATTELNFTAQLITAAAETISLGSNDNVIVVELAGETLSLGENVNCGIIDIGNIDDTITTIRGSNLGVNTDVISLGQAGTSTLVSINADDIVIGDIAIHGKTTSIDTQIIDIGIHGGGAYPCEITIGSDTSTTDIYGDVITIGDPNSQNSTQILSDICSILTNGTSIRTNALHMGSNYTTAADLTAQQITLLGTATTTLRGDTINIGNDNSTDTIQIGNSVSYTEIEGAQINMGVGSVLNTINIGNAFSIVNIQGNQNNAINVAGMFFDQVGF